MAEPKKKPFAALDDALKKAETSQDDREREEYRQLMRSMMLGRVRYTLGVKWLFAMMLPAGLALYCFTHHGEDDPTPLSWEWPVIAGCAAVIALLTVLFFTAGARHRAFRKRLPYAPTGFDETVGGEQAVTIATVTMHFNDTAPAVGKVEEIFLRTAKAGRLFEPAGKSAVAVAVGPFGAGFFNYSVASTLDRIIRKTLSEVHAAYPLERVEIAAHATADYQTE